MFYSIVYYYYYYLVFCQAENILVCWIKIWKALTQRKRELRSMESVYKWTHASQLHIYFTKICNRISLHFFSVLWRNYLWQWFIVFLYWVYINQMPHITEITREKAHKYFIWSYCQMTHVHTKELSTFFSPKRYVCWST
jgi:hypothetical protein